MILRRFGRRGPFFFIEVLILGVGFITAFLSLSSARSALSTSLRVPNPERTYFIGRGRGEVPDAQPLDVLSWSERRDVFSSVGGFQVTPATIETESITAPVHEAWITKGMAAFLPQQVDAGRQFIDGDFEEGSNVVVTAPLVKQLGLASPIGSPLKISGHLCRIVGVFPAWARFPYPVQPEVLLPFSPTPEYGGTLTVLVELRRGLAFEQAERDLNQISLGDRANAPNPVRLVSLKASLDKGAVQVADYGLALGSLTMLVLVVTVSFIELLDAVRRRKEHVIKLALGATIWHLLLERAIEILLICFGGVVVGRLLLEVCWPWFSRAWDTQWTAVSRLDGFTLGSLGALFFFSCLAVGFAPSLVLFAARPYTALKEEPSSLSRPVQRARMIIVALQVAVCVAFALSAAKLGRELRSLSARPLGIQADNIWDAQLIMPELGRMDARQTYSALEQLRISLQSLPGVVGIGFSSEFPAAGGHAIQTPQLTPRGKTPSWDNSGYFVPVTFVDPNYLQLVGCTLLAGRYFTDRDSLGKPAGNPALGKLADNPALGKPTDNPPVILSEPLAHELFGNVNPVGKQIEYRGRENDFAEIVGVVTGMRTLGLKAPMTAELFVPLNHPSPLSFTLKMRSSPSISISIEQLQKTVSEALPGASIKDFRSLRDRFDTELNVPRRRMRLLAFFAVIASGVAAFGLASVLLASIKERDLEIGIRRALGAMDRDLAVALLASIVPWVLVGFVLGLVFPLVFPTPFGIDAGLRPAAVAWSEAPVMVALLGLVTASLWIPLRRAFRRPINDLLRAE